MGRLSGRVWKPALYATTAFVLMGAGAPVVEGMKHIDARYIAFFRFSVGLLAAIVFLIRRRKFGELRKSFTWPVVAGGVLIALTVMFYYEQIQISGPAKATTLLHLFPFLTILLSRFGLGRQNRILWQQYIALVGGGVGVYFVCGGLSDPGSILWGLAAALCNALYVIANQVAGKDTDNDAVSCIHMLAGSVVMLGYVILRPWTFTPSRGDVLTLLGIGVVLGFLALRLTFVACKSETLSTPMFSALSFLEPAVAAAASFGVAHWQGGGIEPSVVLGVVLVLMAGVVVSIFDVKTRPQTNARKDFVRPTLPNLAILRAAAALSAGISFCLAFLAPARSLARVAAVARGDPLASQAPLCPR